LIFALISGILPELVKITPWLPSGALVAILGLIGFKKAQEKVKPKLSVAIKDKKLHEGGIF
jgi:hypothetical protein